MVKICCGTFRTLAFGDASRLEPGDEVVAIGYALGLLGEATITRGIISAIRYNSRLQSDVIQTDAAINPGNSGGPMLSMSGQIMGINSFVYAGTAVQSLGFAVSVKTVQQQIPSLLTGRPAATPTPTPRPPTRTPPSSYASVSAGGFHTCGVGTNGSVAFWGFNDSGQATPPSGSFTSVSAGHNHTCGVGSNGAVVCWGSNHSYEGDIIGQATPPSGSFVSVRAGYDHTCGVKSNGSVVCWGVDYYRQVTLPSGSFTSVSVGGAHACGVKINGSVVCWGSNRDYNDAFVGQATPP